MLAWKPLKTVAAGRVLDDEGPTTVKVRVGLDTRVAESPRSSYECIIPPVQRGMGTSGKRNPHLGAAGLASKGFFGQGLGHAPVAAWATSIWDTNTSTK